MYKHERTSIPINKELYEESQTLLVAREEYPPHAVVCHRHQEKCGKVIELTESIDGVFVKINGLGTVPIDDIRHATEEEKKRFEN